MRARAAHAAGVPGVEQLGLGDRHEHVARLGRLAFHADLTVLEDLRVRRDLRRVPAAGAEALAARRAGDAIAAGHHDRLARPRRPLAHYAAPALRADQSRR